MNKYEVLGVIGEGTFGVVLKCRNKETSEIVAVKKFKEPDSNQKIQRITKREAKILRLLKHENIIQLKEVIRRGGRLHFVFEYMDRNLGELIEEKKESLDEDAVRKLIYQIIRAIDFCHKNDIVHRDVKPENVLIDRNGQLKLCDFDFAKQLSEEKENHTDYVATRWYRAPELLLKSDSYSKAVDMWGIGCIMGELVDRKALFAGENDLHQLCVIQKMIGPLTPNLTEQYLTHPIFRGAQIMNNWQPETLDKHFLGKMSATALDLLKGLLTMDPEKRLTAEQALQHKYFDSLNDFLDLKSPPLSGMPRTLSSPTHLSKATEIDSIESRESIQPSIKELKLIPKFENRDSVKSNYSQNSPRELILSLQNSKKLHSKPVSDAETELRGSLSESPMRRERSSVLKKSSLALRISGESISSPTKRAYNSPTPEVKMFFSKEAKTEQKSYNGTEIKYNESLPASPRELKIDNLSRFHPGLKKPQLITQRSKETLSLKDSAQKIVLKSPLKKPNDSPQKVSEFVLSVKEAIPRKNSHAGSVFKPSDVGNKLRPEVEIENPNQPLIQLPYLNPRYIISNKKMTHSSELQINRPIPQKNGNSSDKGEFNRTLSAFRPASLGSYYAIQNKFGSSYLVAQGTKIKT